MKLPRFSLRGLLLLTALLAGFCYWRDRPRQIANRFVAAIEAGEYKAAESMVNGDLRLVAGAVERNCRVSHAGQTVFDWFTGNYYLSLDGPHGRYQTWRPLVATATGLYFDAGWPARAAKSQIIMTQPGQNGHRPFAYSPGEALSE